MNVSKADQADLGRESGQAEEAGWWCGVAGVKDESGMPRSGSSEVGEE